MLFGTVLLAVVFECGGLATGGERVFVEAESFATLGGWVIDQQFMDVMGSPYLLAHGIGRPVEDAVTKVDFAAAGISIAKNGFHDYFSVVLFAVAAFIIFKLKKSPIIALLSCGALGVIVYGFIL